MSDIKPPKPKIRWMSELCRIVKTWVETIKMYLSITLFILDSVFNSCPLHILLFFLILQEIIKNVTILTFVCEKNNDKMYDTSAFDALLSNVKQFAPWPQWIHYVICYIIHVRVGVGVLCSIILGLCQLYVHIYFYTIDCVHLRL